MVTVARQTKRRLGEILTDEGLLTEDQIQDALKRQKATGELLGESLVKLGYVTENDIARTVSTQFGYPYLNAARYFIPRDIIALVPVETAVEHQIVPLDSIGKCLLVAVAGVVPEDVLVKLEQRTGLSCCIYVSTGSQILDAIKRNYQAAAARK